VGRWADGSFLGCLLKQKKSRSLFDPLVTRSLSGYINSVALGGPEKEILGKSKIKSRENQVIPETNYCDYSRRGVRLMLINDIVVFSRPSWLLGHSKPIARTTNDERVC
jgi:hypothetical protein